MRDCDRPRAFVFAAICLQLALLVDRGAAADPGNSPGAPHDLGFRIASGNEPAAPNKADDFIKPGENLQISVEEDKSFNGIYQVRRGGYIILPQVGRVALVGKTLADAEAAVQHALSSGANLDKASVKIERHQGERVKNLRPPFDR